jgi:tRNA(fMet)-specific endonuclease VapC
MKVALDTNRLTDLFRGDAELAAQLRLCEKVWLPFIVVAEIKAGFYGGARSAQNEALLSRFLDRDTVGILYPDKDTSDHYARLFVQLKHAGTPIPDNDLWISALSIQHELTLLTRDRHFKRIPQIRQN